jgi:hypothetical protein
MSCRQSGTQSAAPQPDYSFATGDIWPELLVISGIDSGSYIKQNEAGFLTRPRRVDLL